MTTELGDIGDRVSPVITRFAGEQLISKILKEMTEYVIVNLSIIHSVNYHQVYRYYLLQLIT